MVDEQWTINEYSYKAVGSALYFSSLPKARNPTVGNERSKLSFLYGQLSYDILFDVHNCNNG